MKVIRINKYDFIIYGSLLAAVVCLGIGAKEYFNSLNEESTMKNELKAAIKEINTKDGEVDISVLQEEPISMQNLNKESILEEYINKILDRIVFDDILTYDIVKTWDKYEVLDFGYNKEVASNYYKYDVNIKLDKGSMLPVNRNTELSTDEYNVITLHIYILDGGENGTYKIKKIES